jgi:AraC-like DNA-binding protein
MNTLLRKAAEQGGVHPLQLDRTSSDFASRIENMSSLAKTATLMSDMFHTYCRLVRDYSLARFSTIVKQTILLIDTDLSADLAPSRLATSQGVSLGYLCAVFKRETGKTLSEYIRERRMEYAAYLLSTTELQIQTIALHCGIMDVQYFSKLFKRQLGLSPTEYIKSLEKI